MTNEPIFDIKMKMPNYDYIPIDGISTNSVSGTPSVTINTSLGTVSVTVPVRHIQNPDFIVALNLVLKYEGGYTNNPKDHGGPTNKGITQSEYDWYRVHKGQSSVSVAVITDEEVRDIYYNNYWLDGKCDHLPPEIAMVHFDSCVNCGIKQASKFLQRVVGVRDDGVIGDMTIAALTKRLNETKDIIVIVNEYIQQRSNFYYSLIEKDPSQRVFITGWNNRLIALYKYVESSYKKTDLA